MQIRKMISCAAVVVLSVLSLAATSVNADEVPKAESLLVSELQSVSGTEVIVSRVTIPPNTTLPKHWHPGEEFAYVIEGDVVLWQEGKSDVASTTGDVNMIPLQQVHTAISGDDGAVILVFRVHPQGEPVRVLVD
jgi:quercetin dioxygenase-like cupin family protein